MLFIVQLMSNPLSMQLFTTFFPSIVSSIPIRRPFPLTSFMNLNPFASPFNFFVRYSPISSQFFKIPSFSITSSTVSATEQTKGFPPNVEACEPGVKKSAISFLATIAPIGIPPPSPFARVNMSGLMLVC